MKLTLKEAKRSADIGYLGNNDEIAKVLRNLLKTQLKELPKNYTTSVKDLLSCGLEWLNDVSDKEFGEYTYLDLICLAKITAETLLRDEPDAESSFLLLSEYVFLNFLQKTAGHCTWTDMFYTVNLKGFMDLLDELAEQPHTGFERLVKHTHRIKNDNFRYSLTTKSTVKDLIEQTDSIMKQYWRPWNSIREFAGDVIVGYEVICGIAFTNIINAFGETFFKIKKEAEKRANR